jgi:hypothetical protein
VRTGTLIFPRLFSAYVPVAVAEKKQKSSMERVALVISDDLW